MKEMNDKAPNEPVILKSIDRAIDVLEYLLTQEDEVSVSRISKELGFGKSTVYRTLTTLENRGYVAQNPETERYFLGQRVFVYGMRKKRSFVSSIMPYLQRLNDKYLDAVTLAELTKDSDDIYYVENLAYVKSRQNIAININGNDQVESYCSSLGKCLLAFDKTVDLSAYPNRKLKKWTPNTIDNYDDLLLELEKIREDGYAVDDEEYALGLFCIGVPIMSGDNAIAAISMSGPVTRTRDMDLEGKIAFMKALSKEITEKVFF